MLLAFCSCQNQQATESNTKEQPKVTEQAKEQKRITREDLKKAAAEKVESVNDSCAIILKIFEDRMTKYQATKDKKQLKEIFSFLNNKTYNDCLENDFYETKFDSIDQLLN